MNIRQLMTAVIALAFSAASTHAVALEYTLIPLGDLPGGNFYSVALDINDRGQVAGQSTSTDGNEGFVWNPDTGIMTGIGDLAGGEFISNSYSINDLGQVTGYGTSDTSTEAIIWTEQDGMVGIGDLPGGMELSRGRAITNRGEISGSGQSDQGRRAFIWDAVNGMRDIGLLSDFYAQALSYDINNRGQAVGRTDIGQGSSYATVGFITDPLTGLPSSMGEDLPGGLARNTPRRINDVGQVVGSSDSDNGVEGYIWDRINGMQGVGDLAGGIFESRAFGVNDKGEVVGTGTTDIGSEPFYWSQDTGIIRLLDVILDGSSAGWTLVASRQINNHGEIVGWGTNPDGLTEAFLLRPVIQSQCP